MNKRIAKLLQVACVITLAVVMLIVAAKHSDYQVHAASTTLTESDVADAYARFRTAATSMNKPLSDWTYGHTYRVDVADYYQVYTDKSGSIAVIICDITFDEKTYTIKFNTLNDYYPGLKTILAQLEYIQAAWPECFINSSDTSTTPDTPDTTEDSSVIFGVGIDDDGDGLYDRYTEPDGVTAYRPEAFNTELAFQMYVIEHLDIYASLVTIDEVGEVYWRETGEYIGITDNGGGNGLDAN